MLHCSPSSNRLECFFGKRFLSGIYVPGAVQSPTVTKVHDVFLVRTAAWEIPQWRNGRGAPGVLRRDRLGSGGSRAAQQAVACEQSLEDGLAEFKCGAEGLQAVEGVGAG